MFELEDLRTLEDGKAGKAALLLLVLGAICLLAATGYTIYTAWSTHSEIIHPAGTWVALAADLANGVFYRPLCGPEGYGGTRYMPLQFIVHAGLIKLTGEPVFSGHLLSLLAGIALYAAAVVFLRKLGCSYPLCIFAAALVFAGQAVQHGIATIRGDLPAAALNMWGLAVCAAIAKPGKTNGKIAAASLFFILAFMTKVTMLFGLVAACIFLLSRNSKKDACKLVIITVGGMLAALLLVNGASSGRFWQSMTACATGGSLSISRLDNVFASCVIHDPLGVVLAAIGLAGVFCLARKDWRELAFLAFALTVLATITMALSPGVDWNHLIDVEVAALVFLVVLIDRRRITPSFGIAVLGLLALLGSAHIIRVGHGYGPSASRDAAVAAVKKLQTAANPIVVEKTGTAILAGHRPYVLDPFCLRTIRRKYPEIDKDFLQKMDTQYFRAFVLMFDPFSGKEDWYPQWYNETHFGLGFLEKLQQRYRRASEFPDAIVYVPADTKRE